MLHYSNRISEWRIIIRKNTYLYEYLNGHLNRKNMWITLKKRKKSINNVMLCIIHDHVKPFL